MRMNKRILVKALASIGACALVGMAAAQTNGPSGFSGRVGAFFPRVGDTNFGAGLDYKFSTVPVDPARGAYASYLGASVDYYGRSNSYNVPLALTYNVRANQLVFSGGVGFDFWKRGGDTGTGLGGQVSATYEFGGTGSATGTGAPIFIQAKYFFANEGDLSGFGLYLGVRF